MLLTELRVPEEPEASRLGYEFPGIYGVSEQGMEERGLMIEGPAGVKVWPCTNTDSSGNQEVTQQEWGGSSQLER